MKSKVSLVWFLWDDFDAAELDRPDSFLCSQATLLLTSMTSLTCSAVDQLICTEIFALCCENVNSRQYVCYVQMKRLKTVTELQLGGV